MIPDILDPRTKIVDELPQPSTWLNYAGDQRGLIGQVLGPNTLGEFLTVVFCAYDEREQKSRVGLAYGVYVKPSELPGLPMSDAAQEAAEGGEPQ
jgi:hypothetical protein